MAPLFLLGILLLHQTISLAGASNIEKTCEAAARRNPSINYYYCVHEFLGHPKSDESDRRGLANIAASLALSNAGYVQFKIEGLIKKPPEPDMVPCLKQCLRLYTDMLTSLSEAVDSINNWRFDGAKGLLGEALRETKECDDGFSKLRKPSPLAAESRDSSGLSTISLTIVDLLQHP